MLHALRLLLLATTAFFFTACSSSRSTPVLLGETTTASTHEQGVPGGILTETTKLDASVARIDPPTREITLTTSDGKTQIIRCGPEVSNFEQIQVGDRVKVTAVSRLELSMANADTLPAGGSLTPVTSAPKSGKPDVIMSESQEYIATVASLNQRRHEATLRFPDDTTRTFTVRPDVDLSQRKVGEKVSVQVSVALSISVQNR